MVAACQNNYHSGLVRNTIGIMIQIWKSQPRGSESQKSWSSQQGRLPVYLHGDLIDLLDDLAGLLDDVPGQGHPALQHVVDLLLNIPQLLLIGEALGQPHLLDGLAQLHQHQVIQLFLFLHPDVEPVKSGLGVAVDEGLHFLLHEVLPLAGVGLGRQEGVSLHFGLDLSLDGGAAADVLLGAGDPVHRLENVLAGQLQAVLGWDRDEN